MRSRPSAEIFSVPATLAVLAATVMALFAVLPAAGQSPPVPVGDPAPQEGVNPWTPTTCRAAGHIWQNLACWLAPQPDPPPSPPPEPPAEPDSPDEPDATQPDGTSREAAGLRVGTVCWMHDDGSNGLVTNGRCPKPRRCTWNHEAVERYRITVGENSYVVATSREAYAAFYSITGARMTQIDHTAMLSDNNGHPACASQRENAPVTHTYSLSSGFSPVSGSGGGGS